MEKKNIAILLFDGAEVLDFAGPFEVFSVASNLRDDKLFNVFTIARQKRAITAVNGLSVNPDYSIADHPKIDILIIAGGVGTRNLLDDREVLDWVANVHEMTEITVSICSGSRILGTLGLLNGKPYCTHHQVYSHMDRIAPAAIQMKHKRFVKAGKVYTSGGISAGIDLSFHILESIAGKSTAIETAAYMEYNLQPQYA
jgi:transcriptional regulator GlxA family with amidase domain